MTTAPNHDTDVALVGRITSVPTILDVVCRITGMGFAAVARVTSDRWIACSVKDDIQFGLKPGGELKLETTICHEIRQSGDAVIIDDVDTDNTYCRHHTPAMYGFKSYISMPIVRADGSFFGTLCAIDPRPHRLNTPETVGLFKLLADLIAFHLDTMDELTVNRASLAEVRHDADLREQFIAVLGHDLRNPVAAIQAGTVLLQKQGLGGQASDIVRMMQSSVSRMAALIDNVLDFARGRLGGGLSLTIASEPLLPALMHVVAELQATAPDRKIAAVFAIDRPIACDSARIGQLLSNLLANALVHGAPQSPVEARARIQDGQFELSVANSGEPIPAAAQAKLFQPFFRESLRSTREGLGLGLYIASEIARAHGGILSATSTPQETRFTFQLPASR